MVKILSRRNGTEEGTEMVEEATNGTEGGTEMVEEARLQEAEEAGSRVA